MLFVRDAESTNKSKVWKKGNISSERFKDYCEALFSVFNNTCVLTTVQWNWAPKLKRSVSTGWLHGKKMKASRNKPI